MPYYKHLYKTRQTYSLHFKHAFYYSMMSLKASYYFFIHALYPDIYTNHGSNTINFLNYIIQKNIQRKIP